MLCDALEGRDGEVGGRPQREGIYVCLGLIHLALRQKPTQHCEVIISYSNLHNKGPDCEDK